jgi:hypothetical protein
LSGWEKLRKLTNKIQKRGKALMARRLKITSTNVTIIIHFTHLCRGISPTNQAKTQAVEDKAIKSLGAGP